MRFLPFLLVVLCACAESQQKTPEAQPIGRFQIVPFASSGALKLDTVTGKAWFYAVSQSVGHAIWIELEDYQYPPQTNAVLSGGTTP
jgi:hypothetical protein